LRKSVLVAFKVVVSVALLSYLFSTTDIPALLEKVRSGDVLELLQAVVVYFVMLGIATWRWKLLLQAQGYPAPLAPLGASYLVASFFNNFLPSNIGGDVIRIKDGSRLTGSATTSLAVVAIDRILGFGALYVLALSAWLFGSPRERHLAGATPVILLLGVFFAFLAYVFFRPGVARTLMRLSGLVRVAFARDRFEIVQEAVHVYRTQVRHVWIAFFASLGLQSLVVWYYYSVAHALGIALDLKVAFLMVPLCNLVQAVPISFNGWGVRESVFILYFHQVGLHRESALAFSLVGAGLIVLLSLSGALVWMTRGAHEPEPPPA
jgi:glycosyltransferase 2 family protein